MKEQNYYVSRKLKLLKDFDKTASLVKDPVVSSYGSDFADTLYREARQEYEALIPQIPHIKDFRGGPLNSFLRITAQELAVYKAMKKHGKTAGEAWEICHEALRLRMKQFPKIKRWLFGYIMYSHFLKRVVKKRAEEGKQVRSGDFEVRYLIGDGESFDYGVDYIACGNYKFLQNQGAEEFAPYVCMSDIALSDAMGWGLIRTETLADGCEKCDFRFKKGGKTQISSKTPEVQTTIKIIRKKEAKPHRQATR
ncbi:L-2-amino-thiazoline-4-carboxylic acid hydrolase [Chloroflexota bacterium]